MKIVSLVLLVFAPLVLPAGEVRPGDTLDEVRATLGTPRGQLLAGGRYLLYYERGEIELRAGVVTRVALLSVDDHAAREARRAAEAVRVREEQEIRRARLSAEGEALKARRLADPAFQAAPPNYQVAFWADFSRRYSDVPSEEQLTAARQRLAEQWDARRVQAEQADRLAELEARLIAAEARADASDNRSYVSFYGGRHTRRHSDNLWPVEYHFNDGPQQPYAATASYPAWGTTPYDLRKKSPVDDWRDDDDRCNARSYQHTFDRSLRRSERRGRF